ncbi:MAG TPA: hypothetical protein O0X01_02210 [Methanocorpusculum sp.]|nr:hypothetical protein [Methanocorpusculum sp.]
MDWIVSRLMGSPRSQRDRVALLRSACYDAGFKAGMQMLPIYGVTGKEWGTACFEDVWTPELPYLKLWGSGRRGTLSEYLLFLSTRREQERVVAEMRSRGISQVGHTFNSGDMVEIHRGLAMTSSEIVSRSKAMGKPLVFDTKHFIETYGTDWDELFPMIDLFRSRIRMIHFQPLDIAKFLASPKIDLSSRMVGHLLSGDHQVKTVIAEYFTPKALLCPIVVAKQVLRAMQEVIEGRTDT